MDVLLTQAMELKNLELSFKISLKQWRMSPQLVIMMSIVTDHQYILISMIQTMTMMNKDPLLIKFHWFSVVFGMGKNRVKFPTISQYSLTWTMTQLTYKVRPQHRSSQICQHLSFLTFSIIPLKLKKENLRELKDSIESSKNKRLVGV